MYDFHDRERRLRQPRGNTEQARASFSDLNNFTRTNLVCSRDELKTLLAPLYDMDWSTDETKCQKAKALFAQYFDFALDDVFRVRFYEALYKDKDYWRTLVPRVRSTAINLEFSQAICLSGSRRKQLSRGGSASETR